MLYGGEVAEKVKQRYFCKYCGVKVKEYADMCGNCRTKLKLVRQLLKLGEQIKKAKKGEGKI